MRPNRPPRVRLYKQLPEACGAHRPYSGRHAARETALAYRGHRDAPGHRSHPRISHTARVTRRSELKISPSWRTGLKDVPCVHSKRTGIYRRSRTDSGILCAAIAERADSEVQLAQMLEGVAVE